MCGICKEFTLGEAATFAGVFVVFILLLLLGGSTADTARQIPRDEWERREIEDTNRE